MNSLLKKYLNLLKNRDFFLLTLIIFIGQLASAFLVLALIASVYKQTGSNFGVSGVILSFAIPGFFLMAFAGLVADIFDRKTIIVVANFVIMLVVLVILLSGQVVYASIPLAFLYFAGNSFFIPASSAATAQLVKKPQILVANSLFIFALAGGVIFGLFAAAVLSFFAGSEAVLIICEFLLILAALLSLFLPKLPPRTREKLVFFSTLVDILASFGYIFSKQSIWFFFVCFALIQGIIAFGITLAPGFFDAVVGINIEKSPILIFPLIGLGVFVGTLTVQTSKFREGFFCALGIALLGIGSLVVGILIKIVPSSKFLFLPIVIYMVMLGLGAVIVMIASRAALQKNVSHHYQGTVFGGNIILASLFSGLLSPAAAAFEAIWGYSNILIWSGAILLFGGLLIFAVANK